MEGHDDAVLCRLGADGAGGVLADVDAPSALVFIATQPQLFQPLGGVDTALIGFGKAVAVAGGAKQCSLFHGYGLSFRKGSSSSRRGQKYHR